MNLESLKFDNKFTRLLPADEVKENYCRQVRQACYSSVHPFKVAQPNLLVHSQEMADLLDLSLETCLSERFSSVFAGNELLNGMEPYATCYGGHQFGNWAGQLGDGRAINLGEIVTEQDQRWVLQLKGAGPTPYARSGDGFAVLRSSVREFLCSEAMFHLGVPTTRALSLVLTGEQIMRDMFYDGRPTFEPGAIVCRTAPSFTRFGNFQIFAMRNELDVLKQLLDYTIQTDFPDLCPQDEPGKEVYLKWLLQVVKTTVEMTIEWMRVGFVHGVMNTDNMSILGLTIDYGPYGWLEDYDPSWTPNTTDAQGRRYCFGNQPQMSQWNLIQLAQAIFPLIEESEEIQAVLNTFAKEFEAGFQDMMIKKLGFKQFEKSDDEEFLIELNSVLQVVETDMPLFYRRLAQLPINSEPQNDRQAIEPLLDCYYQPDQLTDDKVAIIAKWIQTYKKRVSKDGTSDQERLESMNQVNPLYVMRNYLAQLAIDKAEEGDYSLVIELLDVMRNPYQEQEGKEEFCQKRPEWARHKPGCSMLSCSS
ncbi:YdiU family protein [bacterium]|jgi:serine/tyrosine/threonine adenylyltransferase|nr:YdiU family protein [bacterium]